MRTEKDKMLSGELYNPFDPQLSAERRHARLLIKKLNDTRDDQVEERKHLIKKLLPLPERASGSSRLSSATTVATSSWATTFSSISTASCSMSHPSALGHAYYLGQRCRFMPRHICCAPRIEERSVNSAEDRNRRRYLDRRGRDICPGVRIGARSAVGAGSVVTKDIPEDVVAAGNPCRILRKIVG